LRNKVRFDPIMTDHNHFVALMARLIDRSIECKQVVLRTCREQFDVQRASSEQRATTGNEQLLATSNYWQRATKFIPRTGKEKDKSLTATATATREFDARDRELCGGLIPATGVASGLDTRAGNLERGGVSWELGVA
jgi:hypothetical protein